METYDTATGVAKDSDSNNSKHGSTGASIARPDPRDGEGGEIASMGI